MTEKKLDHIVCLVPGFPRDTNDTTRMPAVHQYILYLHRNRPDIQVSVMSLQYPTQKENYVWHGIPVYALASPSTAAIKKMSAWPRAFRTLRRIHKKKAISIIHSFWLGESALIGQWFGKLYRVAHVCTNIGTELVNRNGYIHLIHRSSLNVICQSTFQRKILSKRLDVGNSSIIPFGIDITNQEEINSNSRDIDLLFVGNLNPNKNLPQFLEVAKILIEKGEDLKIRIIGDNVSGLNVNELIANHGLSDCTDYLGRVDNSRVHEEMSRAKILVHTSLFEAGAYVFMEALVNGMYIISRDVGLVKPQPRWRIADATSEFVSNAEEILHSPLDHSILAPYTLSDTLQRHMELYAQLISDKP